MMHIYAYIIPKCLKKSCKDTFFPWQSKPFLNIFSHIHFSINRKKVFMTKREANAAKQIQQDTRLTKNKVAKRPNGTLQPSA
jgi:hypothetical protein